MATAEERSVSVLQDLIDGRIGLPRLERDPPPLPRLDGWHIDWPEDDVLVLFVRNGLTLTIIGEVMGCTRQAVKNRLVRQGLWDDVKHLLKRGRPRQRSAVGGHPDRDAVRGAVGGPVGRERRALRPVEEAPGAQGLGLGVRGIPTPRGGPRR